MRSSMQQGETRFAKLGADRSKAKNNPLAVHVSFHNHNARNRSRKCISMSLHIVIVSCRLRVMGRCLDCQPGRLIEFYRRRS